MVLQTDIFVNAVHFCFLFPRPPSSLSMQSLRRTSVKTASLCRTLPSTLQVSTVMLCPLRSSLQLPVTVLASCSWASTDSWASIPPSLHSLRYDLLKSSMTACSSVTSHWAAQDRKHSTDRKTTWFQMPSVQKEWVELQSAHICI